MAYADPNQQLVVEIMVRDLGRSLDFYRRLGFELLRQEGSFAALAWDGHRFFLDEKRGLPPVPEIPAANVRILVPDVDPYWNLAREMDARIVSPLADRYYGLRDFTLADPDGFGLRFASWLGENDAE